MDLSTIEKNINVVNLIKSIPAGLCIYSRKLEHIEFTIWNKYMVAITGYTMKEINNIGFENPKDIIGQSIYKYTSPYFHDIVKNRVSSQLKSKRSVPIIEETLLTASGNERLYETTEYEKLRTEFFANISHELRTPINVILSSLLFFF